MFHRIHLVNVGLFTIRPIGMKSIAFRRVACNVYVSSCVSEMHGSYNGLCSSAPGKESKHGSG